MRLVVTAIPTTDNPGQLVGVVSSDGGASPPDFAAWISTLYVPGDDLRPVEPAAGDCYVRAVARRLGRCSYLRCDLE
jgi:hypothetical protein